MSKDLRHLEVVRHRLHCSTEGFDKIRRKIHELRRITAGDLSPIVPGPQAEVDDVRDGLSQLSSVEFYDFIVTDYAGGKSNKIMSTIKNLSMQTAYYFPQVEFNNLSQQVSVLNSQYCAVRLGDAPRGCNARDHLKLSLFDYMIGGVGWVKACMRNNRPVLMHCDALDMTWDRDVRLPCDIRWASCKFREPLHVWLEFFGPQALSAYLTAKDDPMGLEDILELEWYYDVEGPEGNWVVFASHDLDKPIAHGPNPYYYEETPGNRMPFIPYEPMYLLQLPSLRVPIGLVEQMMSAQGEMWKAEEYIQTVTERGKPFYTVQDGALDPEELKKFSRGDIGSIITLQPGQGAIQPQQGIKLDPAVVQWHGQNNLELIAQGGANPYSAGSPVQGVSYAAEVNAIQGQSGLMAGNIAKDLAAFWQRSTRKFLAVAKLYDDQPIRLVIDGVDLDFDEYNPVSQYLRPDADIVVQESTLQFKPQAQKIQEATLKLQTAVSMAQKYPQAVDVAFRDWLEAMGEKQLDKWLEQPAAPLQPAVPQELQTAAQDIYLPQAA